MTDSNRLVGLAQRGDLQAFEELVQLYQNRILSYCFQLSGNFEDAHDLAQEVFVQAFRSLKSFRREADFGTWLRRITLNQWINMQRRNKIVTFSLDEPLSTEEGIFEREIAADQDNPLERLEQEEFADLIRKALLKLAPEFRTVLILRDMEDYSYDEIAQILECSLGTVKSRLNRARRYLRDEIERLQKEQRLP